MTADPSFNLCPKHTCVSLSLNSIFNVTRKRPTAFRVKSLLRMLTRTHGMKPFPIPSKNPWKSRVKARR
ncbi:hypothetical protein HK096_004494, partial [Nowakowskiella sp. JEL0078]